MKYGLSQNEKSVVLEVKIAPLSLSALVAITRMDPDACESIAENLLKDGLLTKENDQYSLTGFGATVASKL